MISNYMSNVHRIRITHKKLRPHVSYLWCIIEALTEIMYFWMFNNVFFCCFFSFRNIMTTMTEVMPVHRSHITRQSQRNITFSMNIIRIPTKVACQAVKTTQIRLKCLRWMELVSTYRTEQWCQKSFDRTNVMFVSVF